MIWLGIATLAYLVYATYFLSQKLNTIIMKLSDVKAQIAASAARSTEAFSELGTRIAALQQQIDDLIAGAGDPDITDEAFLADLQTLKTNTDALADIVPAPENPPVEPAQ